MKRALLATLGLVVIALSARAGMTAHTGYDYFGDGSVAIDALARWDLDAALVAQPLMGSFSVLVRAPFVAPVYHADVTTVFLVGSIPCLLAALILGMALARAAAEAGASAAVQGVVAGLAVINPLTFRALHWGHPEEILTAALCVGAVLAAMRERQLVAGVFLGLALASKQWAVLAVVPVILAAPSRRGLLLAAAGAVAGALTVPLFILAPEHAVGVAQGVGGQGGGTVASTTPWNIWWPVAELTAVPEPYGARYMISDGLARLTHPLIVLLAVPIGVLLWRRPGRRPEDALLLLALLFLLRCVLDHWNNDYYHVPLVLSLLAWETVARRSMPVLTLAVTAALGLTFYPVMDQMYRDSVGHAQLSNAIYMGWALPLTTVLALLLFRPRFATRLTRWWPPRQPRAAVRMP